MPGSVHLCWGGSCLPVKGVHSRKSLQGVLRKHEKSPRRASLAEGFEFFMGLCLAQLERALM